MPRDAGAVMHELDYWRALLEDLHELNRLVRDAAGELVRVPLDLLAVAFREQGGVELERAGTAAESTMRLLGEMGEPLGRMIELAAGRAKAIEPEVAELREAAE